MNIFDTSESQHENTIFSLNEAVATLEAEKADILARLHEYSNNQESKEYASVQADAYDFLDRCHVALRR